VLICTEVIINRCSSVPDLLHCDRSVELSHQILGGFIGQALCPTDEERPSLSNE
jgi:hypothetical protein